MLHNHQVIGANHFKLVPMTGDVIRHLNAFAAQDRVKVTASAPFFTHGQPLPDIADYDDSPTSTSTAPCTPSPAIIEVTVEDEPRLVILVTFIAIIQQ